MGKNALVDSRDQRFVLFEMLQTDKMGEKFEELAEFDRDTYDEILDLAERIGVEKFYEANESGDREGCTWNPDTKEVSIPKAFHDALNAYYEAGFISLSDNVEMGGMGMPIEMNVSVQEMLGAGCFPAMMYPGLSHGAMLLIDKFGTDDLKAKFNEKMLAGEWGGTMCLTEPEAGSDVGALKAKAVKQDDGTYLISGQKIFISSGDNDYYSNMVHPVLARIEGDPAGTKGISIFIVPKYRVNDDGSMGEFNDVTCTGIEHKMGIKGSATATLSFGDEGKCVGYLLGEEKKGMKIMFHMMNEARLGVGLQGLAIASAAYMHAVTFAKNRLQGVHVTQMMNPEAEKVNIVQHPDVKRMLLWMKSQVEGMRVLTYFLAHQLSIEEMAEGDESKEARALAEIMIPICKAGNTDASVLVTSEAVQVYGGYGYTQDYPIEQMMRDSKITTIYEGTNGIQAMDLTMRKILMNENQYNYSVMKKRMEKTIEEARGVVADKYVDIFARGLEKLDETIELLKKQMAEGKFMHLFMNATPLEQAMHMLVLAWAHLWSMTVATPRMKELVGDLKGPEREALLNDNDEAAYYSGKVLSGQFYIGSEFPKYFGRIEAIHFGETAVIKSTDATFTGALDE